MATLWLFWFFLFGGLALIDGTRSVHWTVYGVIKRLDRNYGRMPKVCHKSMSKFMLRFSTSYQQLRCPASMWPYPSEIYKGTKEVFGWPLQEWPSSWVFAGSKHSENWFIRKTPRGIVRVSGSPEAQWGDGQSLLPFSWLRMCLQSLKECEKVAWGGFDKHERDLRKHVRGGKKGKRTQNEKDLGMHLRLITP